MTYPNVPITQTPDWVRRAGQAINYLLNNPGGGGTTTNALTLNTTGGAAPGATFNGSAAITVDFSTVGAAKTGAVVSSNLTMATGKLLGRSTAGTGAIEELGTVPAANFPALTGDVTTSAGALATTIANNAVTYAKMQDVTATSRIIGRKTAGSGDPEECTLSDILDFIGSAAQGDILYRGASGWARLAAGTSGQLLQTQGSGANPQWVAQSAGGASLVLIASQTVTGSSVASVSFTSIPSTYIDLYIVARARGSAAAAAVNLQMQVNGDTTANYDWNQLNGVNSAVADTVSLAQTSIRIGVASAASAINAGRFGNATIDVLQYANTAMEKDVMSRCYDNASHSGATNRHQLGGGTWRSTSAINRIDFLMDTGNIDVGSVFLLYGRLN